MAEQLESQQPRWKIWHQLPLRPPPVELESLTSYLMRVAQANGIQEVTELVTLAGGTPSTWQCLCSFPDGSAMSILGLTTLTGRTQANLEAMTFLPLARHFGRANSTQTLRRFLRSSLASHLRYCPLCLAEHDFPYYRLPWRFLLLSGCITHQCQLLDHCGHCGVPLPLLASQPHLAACPICRKDLRTCRPSLLEDDELRQLDQKMNDLTFLLSSPVQTQEENPRVALGKRYALIRRELGRSLQEIISLTELNPQILSEIEYAGISKKATFLDYVQYANVLGMSLKEVLSVSIPPVPLSDEDMLLASIDEAIQGLGTKEPVPQNRDLSSRVGIRLRILRQYPRVNSHLVAWTRLRQYARARQDSQREEELVQSVLQAKKQLEAQKKPVSQRSIAQMIGLTVQTLWLYPRVETLLLPIASKHHLSKPQSYQVSLQRLLSSTNASAKEAADEGKQS